ncbi:hypothetical protein DFH08DRAFT_946822 [Mycena albidolilacea]|uniref:Uncharacterized protein n=1 Tax=Mycena albidolilacea TaxID=1033008 RepID=A0AAD7F687_9AGAR|nr:hypothetical protein DFH08DRAFT_946822 [Mycena albidolilacea]
MAAPSKSAPRLHTKSSDVAQVSRTSSRATDVDEPPSSPTFLSEPESPVRKRSSRIPFLGRQRKKSTQSDASGSSAGPSSRHSDADVRHSNVSKKSELRPDIPAVPPLDERPLPALPPQPLTNSSPSLGSKIAARFAPSRQKLFNLSPRKPARPPSNEPISDALSPPISVSRPNSTDSVGTSTDDRSITPRPRPVQPTITVSLPPDQLEGYEGMFTLPSTSSTSIDDPHTPTTSNTPPLRFPRTDTDNSVKRRSSRSAADERSSSRASRISRKHVAAVFRPAEVDSTDAEDSEAVMSDSPKPSPPMNVRPTPTAEKRRTLATMPYNFSAEKASPRSIMKPTSDRPHRPPAFPPPPTNPPSSALPVIPPSLSRTSNGSPTLISPVASRQRAQTLSSVPSSPLTASSPPMSSLSTIPSRRITKSIGEGSARAGSPLAKKSAEETSEKENLDLDKASPEQLRQALRLRNQQFDELASYLLKITDAHVAEQQALLKKVASLEQEAGRLKNEIKGLTWLVKQNTRPGTGGSIGESDKASKSMSALELLETSDGELSSSLGPYNPSEDSGAESHPTTSGAEESYRTSGGTSGSGGESSSSSGARKVKRNHTLMSSFYRSSFKNARPEGESVIPVTALPYRSSPSNKRSSVSSFGTGTSPSSSTSSLSLGTLTPATTVISLDAIPETAAPRPQDPVVAAAILATENQRAKEERRASRASNRLSASSVTAPSASASYSANLKRARPPSIAQVLAQSPKMEHGRDRLRSYTSGSASS